MSKTHQTYQVQLYCLNHFKNLKPDELHMFQVLKFIFDFTDGITSESLSNMFQPSNLIHQYNKRYNDLYHLTSYKYVK